MVLHIFHIYSDGIGVSAPLASRSGGLGRWCLFEGVVGRSGGAGGLSCGLFEVKVKASKLILKIFWIIHHFHPANRDNLFSLEEAYILFLQNFVFFHTHP